MAPRLRKVAKTVGAGTVRVGQRRWRVGYWTGEWIETLLTLVKCYSVGDCGVRCLIKKYITMPD